MQDVLFLSFSTERSGKDWLLTYTVGSFRGMGGDLHMGAEP